MAAPQNAFSTLMSAASSSATAPTSAPVPGGQPPASASTPSSIPEATRGRPKGWLASQFKTVTAAGYDGKAKRHAQECDDCGDVLPPNMCRLPHLAEHVLHKCRMATQEKKKKVQDWMAEVARAAAVAPAGLGAAPPLSSVGGKKRKAGGSKQSSMSTYAGAEAPPEHAAYFDSLVLKLFITAGLSFAVAATPAWQALITALRPGYSPPS